MLQPRFCGRHWAACFLLLFLLAVDSSSGLQCMTGSHVSYAFIVNNVCYWTCMPGTATSWSMARSRCQEGFGDLAVIDSASTNAQVALALALPSFIGYHKDMSGTWQWVTGASTYSQAFVDGSPVEMTMANGTGTWTSDFFDASYLQKGFVCSTPMSELECMDLIIPNSIASANMPISSSYSVSFTCLAGYQMSSGIISMTVTCLSTKLWNDTVLPCSIITCGKLTLPDNTMRNTENVTVNTVATYTCKQTNAYFAPGAPLMGTQYMTTCLSTGFWSSIPPTCVAYSCSQPQIVQYATLSKVSLYHGAVLTYTCLSGYMLPESVSPAAAITIKTIQCSANATYQAWIPSGLSPPSACIVISCGALPLPLYTVIDTNVTTANTLANVWCLPGYGYPDSTKLLQQATCLKTSYWSGNPQACFQLTCPSFSVQNAYIVGNFTNSYIVNATLTFKCVNQTLFPGGNNTFVTTCTDSGEFYPKPPSSGCEVGTCQLNWYDYNRHCYFVSNPKTGILRSTSAETSCVSKSAHLVDIQDQAENDFVSLIANLYVASVTLVTQEYWIGWTYVNNMWQWSQSNALVNFTNWMDGYPDYPGTYLCSAASYGGQWKDKPCTQMLPYICKKTEVCGSPPTIDHGVMVTSPAPTYGEIGQTILYKCNSGYIFPSLSVASLSIQCSLGGYWTYIESCQLARCSSIKRVVSATPSTTSTLVSTVLSYTCPPGFSFKGGSSMAMTTCNASRQWYPSVDSSCYATQCAYNVSNANRLYGNITYVGAMDLFTCLPGYILPDGGLSGLFSCSALGFWMPNVSCQAVVCPPYPYNNATSSLTSTGAAKYKDVTRLTCIKGYYMGDNYGMARSVICTAYATWNESLPACVRKPCESVPIVGMADCSLIGDITPLAFSKVNCSCLNGSIFLNGVYSMVLTCNSLTLTWQGVPSKCVDHAIYLQSKFNHTAVEAPGATAYGSMGIVIISFIVFTVIVLDAVTLKMHRGS